MLNLIALELKKNKLQPFLMALACIFLALLGFSFLMYFAPKMEPVPMIDNNLFTNWNYVISLIATISFCMFSILGAVMHAKVTVSEYAGKRSILILSYPQSRKKILCAKCGLVSLFTTISMISCTMAAFSIFAMISNQLHLLPEPFTMAEFLLLAKTTAISSLLAASVGLIALRIGLWKGSQIGTIVASLLLISPFGNVTSLFPDKAFFIYLFALGILFAMAIVLLAELCAKVNKMEVR